MPSLYVASNGLSIWHSQNLGETLTRIPSSTGLYSGSRVWALLDTAKGMKNRRKVTHRSVWRAAGTGRRLTQAVSVLRHMAHTAVTTPPDESNWALHP